MKKIISLLLSLILVFSIATINTYAIENDNSGCIDISKYTNSELDLSKYSIEDILNMTSAEYIELVKDFERVYDPYDSYIESEDSVEFGNLQISGNTASPLWTSGETTNDEWTEVGCHEYITSVACLILTNDKGFFSNQAAGAVSIMLLISLASLLPDKDENSGIFVGHFYDPDTGKNYAGGSTNTAKNNAANHYTAAVNAAKAGAMDEAFEHLGRCLHYVQDANVPHHAANITSLNPSHSAFEKFAFENAETYLSSYSTISSSYYTTATNNSVATLTHNAAVTAKSKKGSVNNILNKSEWEATAKVCLKAAARYSAIVMYKFSREKSVPFYSN